MVFQAQRPWHVSLRHSQGGETRPAWVGMDRMINGAIQVTITDTGTDTGTITETTPGTITDTIMRLAFGEVMWCGVAWRGVAWRGVVCGVVWCGVGWGGVG